MTNFNSQPGIEEKNIRFYPVLPFHLFVHYIQIIGYRSLRGKKL